MTTVSAALVIRFQLASTALTVIRKAAPAVCAAGEPVLPEAVPGATVSPGVSTSSLENAPARTPIVGLVLLVMAGRVTSAAVTVALPAVLNVTVKLKFWVPPTKAAFAGMVAFGSLEVMPTVSLTVLIKFQLASTALTVTLKGTPAARGEGVPVLPLVLPGAAVSPGTSN